VASQREGFAPLLDYLADGKCEIGAQLHPWLTPPIVEELNERNSFAGNLPETLEYAKIRILTETIQSSFGCKPAVYRAGRYGFGPRTPAILARLGYKIDCSVRPFYDMRLHSGPDFRTATARPFWLGAEGGLLEIPVTVHMTGLLAGMGAGIYPVASLPAAQALHLPGILAKLHLLDRVPLTPEGVSLAEAKRLTRSLLKYNNHRIFVLSYHTPSLQAGNTPYVRTNADLKRFLSWIEAYLEFFLGEIGGVAATPMQIFDSALHAAFASQSRIV
jgi:hypothetical protein